MGQKVHPTGIRLGIIKKHTSVWYANSSTYADKLLADIKARTFIQKKLASASVSRVDIERPSQTARVTIHSARPGVVIGKKGEDVERLRNEVAQILGVPVHINIEEIRLESKLWFQDGWAELKSPERSGIVKAVCLCIPCVRT